jgi:hypothetical protein
MEARAAATAAAAFGASRSTALGSAESQTRKATNAFQIPESDIYHPLALSTIG